MTSVTKTEVLTTDVINCLKTNGTVKQNGIANGSAKTIANGVHRSKTTYKGKLPKEIGTDYNFKRRLVWPNIIGFIMLHLAGFVALLLFLTSAHWFTDFWSLALIVACGQGVTMGAHRLFSHKTFKATFIVRLVLITLQTMSGQNCMYVWARDHRLHHKYSDTDADPHNSHRGFFFSHIGWLMSRKHPAVIIKGKTIDMSDLEADPLVMIQKKFYKSLYLLFSIAIPVSVPVYFWGETYINSFFVSFMFRYIITLHATWSVNSVAHMFGTKPYDETMRPVESSFVSLISTGEGYHNYHHAFPWDYRASELGTKFNITTILIDLLASLGLVYDLKAAKENMVEFRCLKAGDGSHPKYGPMKIAKDALQNNKEEKKYTKENDDKKPCLETDTASKETNETLKNNINEDECQKEEPESILVKDSATGETTVVKRNTTSKHLLEC